MDTVNSEVTPQVQYRGKQLLPSLDTLQSSSITCVESLGNYECAEHHDGTMAHTTQKPPSLRKGIRDGLLLTSSASMSLNTFL